MIRFRTLLFLLSLTALTALASYSFFDPFTSGKPHVAVLDTNCDTNPYDDDFFTPDNSGLQSNRQKSTQGETLPVLFAFSSDNGAYELFPIWEIPFPCRGETPFCYVNHFLSSCQPVRAGPFVV